MKQDEWSMILDTVDPTAPRGRESNDKAILLQKLPSTKKNNIKWETISCNYTNIAYHINIELGYPTYLIIKGNCIKSIYLLAASLRREKSPFQCHTDNVVL